MTLELAVNPNVVEMEYAVRGPIPKRAAELRRQGRTIIPCNIGNPQALGQRPITFYRQVTALLEDPSRVARERRLRSLGPAAGLNDSDVLSEYVLEVAAYVLSEMSTGLGAYTESAGPAFIREAVARFIDRRDGDFDAFVPSDPDNIFITNGASEAATRVIELLISGPKDGIMIPIPQYPLYSAAITRCGGAQVSYHPDEASGWTLSREALERSLAGAREHGITVKGIVVINPGNPTGALLPEGSVRDVVDFAEEHHLLIIADEVYQENVYGREFVSFARVLGKRDVPLCSLHSVSKGFYGECGRRGGYLELRNPPQVVGSPVTVRDLLVKQASVNLCSNTTGQALVYLMVNPPPEGSDPHALFAQERQQILDDLHDKALMIKAAFREMVGVECPGEVGAMYLFPRLGVLPTGSGDFDYCMHLLEQTGLSTVNGAGFGQAAGTHHLRIAFLPDKALLHSVLPRWIEVHNEYVGA